MVGRAAALLPELALLLALGLSFLALLGGTARAGRLARAAWAFGATAALVAAIATVGRADDFLFGAYRVDAFSQLIKAMVMCGALAAAYAARHEHDARVTGPFLRLASVTALVAAASAADLVLLWILLELSTLAHVIVVASEGRRSDNERELRSLVAAWLPTSVVFALGAVIAGAEAETTRFAEIEGLLPALGGMLICIAVLVRVALAPLRAALAIARGGEGVPMAVLAGASWWTLGVAVTIRVAALSSSLPEVWAVPALIALAAVPAALASLVITRPGLTGRRPGSVVLAALIGLGVFAGAIAWAPAAGAALP